MITEIIIYFISGDEDNYFGYANIKNKKTTEYE